MRTRTPLTLAAIACLGAPAAGDLVSLIPSQDNTLFQENLEFSNGQGPGVFLGRTSAGWSRRTLMMFDIAGSVPAGSTIESVTLAVRCTRARGGSYPVGMHRLLASWGEGASNAGDPGGGGAPAFPGDATWSHRFYGQAGTEWATPGGDFAALASASVSMGNTGAYTFASTALLVADVQAMLDNPAGNHGWALIGNESVFPSAKRLASGENATASYRPTLTITYTPIPAPAGAGVLIAGAAIAARRRRPA